jgi:fructosamine-3-kinase
MSFPRELNQAVVDALAVAGDTSELRRLEPMRGGMMSKAWRVATKTRSYCFKYNEGRHSGRYSLEARDLGLLRGAGVRVPDAYACADKTDERPGYILLEWIECKSNDAYRRRLGSSLGEIVMRMHRAGADEYGHPDSGWDSDWVRYYRDVRLGGVIESLRSKDLLDSGLSSMLDKLLARLDSILGRVERQPALLHGDLHYGNVLSDRNGTPTLIDPVVYYGDREAEIAYTELYPGFAPAFFHAYKEAWPLADGFKERKELYLLKEMLDHLNQGNARYLPTIEAIACRYAGA